jgi:hypothetical protein
MRTLEFELQQLPYALGGAYWALNQLLEQQRAIADALQSSSLPIGATQVISPDEAYELSYAFDSFLSFCRRAQDATVLYIRRVATGPELPRSMADVVKKRGLLPGHLESVVIEYWSSSGSVLKTYRDLGVHHALVSSDARFTKTENGDFLYFAIPNNPDCKSAAKLRFSDPVVYAFPYARDAFLALFSFTYQLLFLMARYLGYTTRLSETIFFPREAVHANSALGHPTPSPDYIEQSIWALRAELKTVCTQRFGPLDSQPLKWPSANPSE